MLESLVTSVTGSWLNQFMSSTYWLWPVLEIIHFFGLSLLFGGLLVIDLRMAGHVKGLDASATHKLLPVVFLGFALNLATGILFFYGDPLTYANNALFQLKMVLILMAGCNALLYYWKVRPLMAAWKFDSVPPLMARCVAYTSLAIWTVVLLCGRLIPYIGEYGGTGI